MGDWVSISGRGGYRYGSIGTFAGNGVFIEYICADKLGNAMFDELVGCYIFCDKAASRIEIRN